MTTTERPRARRPRVLALAATLAVGGAIALAGCSSSGGSSSATADSAASSAASGTAASAAASASASSTAIPTQDVVSSIAEDPKLNAELPASVRSSGKLILGTTLNPGTSGLPHGGQVNGQNVGLDVDLRNAVAKVLGVNWDVQNGTFATIIPGVQNGKY